MKIRLERRAQKEIDKGREKAEILLANADKLEKFLQDLERKLNKIPGLGTTFAMVPIMISLVRSFVKREYKEIPKGTIVGIISVLAYILLPIDVLPDIIPGLGYADDAFVLLTFLRKGAEEDIVKYQKWRFKNNKFV